PSQGSVEEVFQMPSATRFLAWSVSRPYVAFTFILAVMVAVLFLFAGTFYAQQPAPLHLNPAVEKLAHGQPMIGGQTDDMSLQNCHSLARLDFDYVYVDMEHGPLNLDGVAYCVAAMVD